MRLKLIQFLLIFTMSLLLARSFADESCLGLEKFPLSRNAIISKLGWVQTGLNRCGGYYLEQPFSYPDSLINTNSIQITSNQLLFAQHGTSYGQGKVTISRFGQQIIANKAYLYRDPVTGKLRSIALEDEVTLREPNNLIVAKNGQFDFLTKTGFLHNILYRTAIYSKSGSHPVTPDNKALQEPQKVYQLSAWGQAAAFRQDKPKIFEFDNASYTTCSPTTCIWEVKAKHIVLNKNTGRGTATGAKILVKGVPVAYVPYLNFPIDDRRKTGFLWPTAGMNSASGSYLTTPFYWNMAPNYDMTITPAILGKRGFQVADYFRYLTPASLGNFHLEALPDDQAFKDFKSQSRNTFQNSTDPVTQSELRRLLQASNTRKSFDWVDQTHFNENWSSKVDYSWVSDDYYLRDFRVTNLNQITQNQLLQLGEINYKSPNWYFTGRVQGYQTLHPIDVIGTFYNSYTRAPQLVLGADYPDMPLGLNYFMTNDLTRFDIRNNPGSDAKYPMGTRLQVQPGISRTFNQSYITVTPRLQLAMTQYKLGDVIDTNPKSPSRTLPIFDLNTQIYFDRNVNLFQRHFRQTLEPRVYYVYIPYKNQNDIPLFDTTVNTLTYDQLFMYNRFSGYDRLNDANQVGVGLTTRFIDQQNGFEKVKAAIGQLYYFKKRSVTLCAIGDPLCPNPTDTLSNPQNQYNRSPITGLLSYGVNPNWTLIANTIWDDRNNQLNNQSVVLHYQPPGSAQILNLGYNFVRNGDTILTNSTPTPDGNLENLSTTDISFNYPIFRDWTMIGRWTQNLNQHHFQNLLYGVQYDSCCWAVRIVTGRAFTNLNLNNTYQYDTQFYIQLALKGLGAVPITGGDPTQLLSSSIAGYPTNFGQDF